MIDLRYRDVEQAPTTGVRMTTFSDLTPEQRCVMNNAIDEGDLRGLLTMWNPQAPAPLDSDIERLGAAVLQLVEQGLVEVRPVTSGLPPLPSEEVARVLAFRPAWEWEVDDTDDDGETPMIVWTVLTAAGRAVLSTGTSDQLWSFRQR